MISATKNHQLLQFPPLKTRVERQHNAAKQIRKDLAEERRDTMPLGGKLAIES